MKKLLLTVPLFGLVSCSSFQNASVADYNGDGVVSDAESKQYHKQASVQERNVYTESVKRRNAVNTTGDALEGVRNISRLRGIFLNGF